MMTNLYMCVYCYKVTTEGKERGVNMGGFTLWLRYHHQCYKDFPPVDPKLYRDFDIKGGKDEVHRGE